MRTITVIMTGGQSSRMGRDKGALPFGGETMLTRLIARWTGVFDGVAVSVDQPGRYGRLSVPEIPDLRHHAGPMAGLEASLAALDADAVFLTAVDLPFGSPDLARRLSELRGDADVCLIRRRDGRPESLFALYSAACLPVVRASLDRGERAFFRGLFPKVKVRDVWEEELPTFQLDRVLFNVNHPQDLQSALECI